jgi:hypothetical protein
MVLTHRSLSFGTQCQLVALTMSVSSLDCCDHRPDGPCDLPASDDEITNLYKESFGISSATLVGKILIGDIVAELNRNAPVEIGYSGSGSGRGAIGHVVLVYGWQETPTGISFSIHNPLIQAQTVRADFALPGRIDQGLWDATWKGL